MKREHTQSAFTLVELLIVIVVIAILAAITIIAYNGVATKAHIASVQSDLSNAQHLMEADNATGGAYPLTIGDVNEGKGVPASDGTQYTYHSNGISYCIEATSTYGNVGTWYVSSDGGAVTAGDCPSLTMTDFPASQLADTAYHNNYTGSGYSSLWVAFKLRTVSGTQTIKGIWFDSPVAQSNVTLAFGGDPGEDTSWGISHPYIELFSTTMNVVAGRNRITFPSPITLQGGAAYYVTAGTSGSSLDYYYTYDVDALTEGNLQDYVYLDGSITPGAHLFSAGAKPTSSYEVEDIYSNDSEGVFYGLGVYYDG